MTTSSKRKNARRSAIAGTVFAALSLFVLSVTSRAQSFSSGSDGSDGALTIAANQGTIIFDPTDIARWGKVLDADGDGVYNFTTISVGAGSILRLQGDIVNRPVYWLASGNVTIDGTLDLSGSSGPSTADLSLRRQLAVPGSGGYAGGAGGLLSPSIAATPGDGPGGGSGGQQCIQNNSRICGTPGTFSGNRYALPLVGGSGGAGGVWDSYFGGGAGGGAISIGSSTLIAVNGTITAAGGSTPSAIFQSGGFKPGGGGSGGVIRLVAPTLSGNGHLNVVGGNVGVSGSSGSAGLVRLESFSGGTSFVLDAGGTVVTRGSPVDPSTLRPASSIRVTSIDGIPVAPNPSGSFVLPDVTISNGGAVNVAIQATGIPNGTVVTLQVFPQTPTDLTVVNLPTAQATLSGTIQSSTATATFTFPYGFSRGFVRATWTQ